MKLRLAYIEALILTQNKVNRKDLQAMFGIKSAAAGRDFYHYNKSYPGNLQYCLVNRCYQASADFTPQVLTTSTSTDAIASAPEFLVNLTALEDYF